MLKAAVEVAKVVWDHPANRGNRPLALAKAVGWQAIKRFLPGPLTIRTTDGYKFICYADSGDGGRMIYFNGQPDPSEMTFLRKYLRPGDAVLDIGANVGVYTLFAAHIVGPTGRVIAVEPDPINISRTKENCRLNGFSQVEFFEGALANYQGEAEFTTRRDTGNHLAFATGRASRSVRVSTIDALIGQSKFDVVKIDAEGAEALIIKGAVASIAAGRLPVFVMEIVDRYLVRAGSSLVELRSILEQMDYQLLSFDTGRLNPWERKDRRPGQVGDAIIVHRAALPAVNARLASWSSTNHRAV